MRAIVQRSFGDSFGDMRPGLATLELRTCDPAAVRRAGE